MNVRLLWGFTTPPPTEASPNVEYIISAFIGDDLHHSAHSSSY